MSQHGGMMEGSSALSVLLVHIRCILEQKLTGDQRPLKFTGVYNDTCLSFKKHNTLGLDLF